MSQKIVHKVPQEQLQSSIETLKVQEPTLQYLRDHGFKTIEDFVDRQFEIPEEHRGRIYGYLFYGIEYL